MQIGTVRLECPYILAPMAGVTDLPFRLLCREMGAGMVCAEMVSAKALSFNNRNTLPLLKTEETERPVSLQLFGSDPEIISAMAARIEPLPFDILDINMGCPVPKVTGNGEGSALMKDPLLTGRIIARTVEAVRKPVTVKIRKGFDEKHVNAVEIAHIAQESGAAAVAVHGRTREQYYRGEADWDIIREVKNAVSIPVIGSGDVTDPASAQAMMRQTGCDAVMIGRAARGNPWVFKRLNIFDRTGADPGPPAQEEICDMILRHARMLCAFKGEMIAMREMRKHVGWYTAGLPHSAGLRRGVNDVTTYAQLEELLGVWHDGARLRQPEETGNGSLSPVSTG